MRRVQIEDDRELDYSGFADAVYNAILSSLSGHVSGSLVVSPSVFSELPGESRTVTSANGREVVTKVLKLRGSPTGQIFVSALD